MRDLLGPGVALVKDHKELKDDIGEFTFRDIIQELEKPGRDPRDAFVPFSFRDDIFEMKDLKPEMVCPGIVTNVTNFGAFVDIGVHQDGLVHISQLADRFVKDPRQAVSPGDQVRVKVLEVNLEKNQISLTMRNLGTESARTKARDVRGGDRGPRPPRDEPRRDDRGHARTPQVRDRGPRPNPIRPSHAGGQGRPPKPAPAPKNNPFGALAALRKDLKPKQ